MGDTANREFVRTVCRECGKNCNISVRIDNGRAVAIEPAAGLDGIEEKLCWKAQAGLERLYHPDRLQQPLKRAGERGQGQWQPISWQEALDMVADRLLGDKEMFGAESVAFIKGHYDRRCDWISRLAYTFGTPNLVGIDNTCYIPSASGRLMTYGFDGRPDFAGRPKCVFAWGTGGMPPVPPGARLIVVNTLRTDAARKADIWLQPRPATDLALALGILHVIINEGLYDHQFVRQWTIGFERLKAHLAEYTPRKVSDITWVPEQNVVKAARAYADASPACLYQGNASEDTRNSTQFARTLAIIQAVCGNLDIPGGTIAPVTHPFDHEGTATDVRSRSLPQAQIAKKLGAAAGHFPFDDLWESIANKPAELQAHYLVSALLEDTPYPVKSALVMGCNPLLTWANSSRVYEALQRLEFLAVADMFMTPTAMLADLVLPAASYLEFDAVVVKHLGKGDTYVQAQRKAVQIGQCRSDLDIVISLAHRLGLSDHFWKDVRKYLDNYLKPVGINFSELCRLGQVISSGFSYRKYLEKGFTTPSGKVELYSNLCEKWGYDPLPIYQEPQETPISAPQMKADYPLILTSTHEAVYIHSQGRHLNTTRDKLPEPTVLIHPDTAATLEIRDGDMVYIENERGRIRQKAVLSEGVDPRVVNVSYGWWFPEKGIQNKFGWDEANINILTDDGPPYSHEIGSPSMRGFLCRVYK